MGSSKSTEVEPPKPPEAETLSKGRASLKVTETRERSLSATEKPDASELVGAKKKLAETTTTEKVVLPTAADIKSEGDAKETAEAALTAQRKSLKGVEITVKQVLPSAEDIKKESEATDMAADALAAGKVALKPTETKESAPIVVTEKPDASQLTKQRKSLKSTETEEKNVLPSADDLKDDGAKTMAAEKSLQEGKDGLKKVEPVVKQVAPSADDINQEKAATEQAAEILTKRRSTLTKVETVEKHALPTPEDIAAEKKDTATAVVDKVDTSESMAATRSETRKKTEQAS